MSPRAASPKTEDRKDPTDAPAEAGSKSKKSVQAGQIVQGVQAVQAVQGGQTISFKEVDAEIKKWLYETKNPSLIKTFEQIEASTGAKREHAFYGFAGLIALYLIIGSGAQLICNLIGFAYPAYASVLAIRTEEKDDDTLWLTYWAVFGFFSVLDFWAENIWSVFPLFFLVKAIFLLYLYLPQTQGSVVLYKKVVDPLVTKIDEASSGKK